MNYHPRPDPLWKRLLRAVAYRFVLTGSDAWDLGLYATERRAWWRFALVTIETDLGVTRRGLYLFCGDLKTQWAEFDEGWSK